MLVVCVMGKAQEVGWETRAHSWPAALELGLCTGFCPSLSPFPHLQNGDNDFFPTYRVAMRLQLDHFY